MGTYKMNNVLRLARSAPTAVVRKTIRRLKDHRLRPIITVSWKAMRQKKRLAPGEFVALNRAERSDQQFLLKQSQRVGPLFKAIWGRKYCTCMVGLPLCRRFLEQHSNDLTSQSLELESFFAKGFLRRMQGEDHKKYRRLILKVLIHSSSPGTPHCLKISSPMSWRPLKPSKQVKIVRQRDMSKR